MSVTGAIPRGHDDEVEVFAHPVDIVRLHLWAQRGCAAQSPCEGTIAREAQAIAIQDEEGERG